jgi:uncharacterized protein
MTNEAIGHEPLPLSARPSPTDVLGFLAFSHGWTWLFWAAAGAWGTSVWEPPASVFFVIGGAGVIVGGLVMSRLTYGSAGLRELGRRVFDPRRASGSWWLVVLLLYPALTLLAIGVSLTVGAPEAPLGTAGLGARIADPLGLLAMVGFVLVIGPLPEEIGWRGYLLDCLQLRWSALTASLILGLIWWSWHLPLFLLPGYFEPFGRAAPTPLDLLLGILPAAIVYTWVYNNTERSVLALIVLHFMHNFTGQLLGISEEVRTIRLLLEIALPVVVVAWWGPRTLRRGRPLPAPPQPV